jgi:hypothetical protein
MEMVVLHRMLWQLLKSAAANETTCRAIVVLQDSALLPLGSSAPVISHDVCGGGVMQRKDYT